MPWEKSLNSEISTVVAGYLSAVVMKDGVSSGCFLFVQLWSSSHTYVAKNVHDNNLCLYTFIMLVVDPLLPENVFFPLQFQSSFTYAILIFCIQFTLFYLLFTYSKTQKISLSQNTHFILLLRTLFSITFSVFNSRVIRLQASCSLWDRYLYFETSYKRSVHLQSSRPP